MDFAENSLDAVVSFYAIFHIKREMHLALLKRLFSFIKPGGYLLITMGAGEWEGTEPFHGVEMFWSHYGSEKNKEIIQSAGFTILQAEVDTSGGEKHLVVFAQKA